MRYRYLLYSCNGRVKTRHRKDLIYQTTSLHIFLHAPPSLHLYFSPAFPHSLPHLRSFLPSPPPLATISLSLFHFQPSCPFYSPSLFTLLSLPLLSLDTPHTLPSPHSYFFPSSLFCSPGVPSFHSLTLYTLSLLFLSLLSTSLSTTLFFPPTYSWSTSTPSITSAPLLIPMKGIIYSCLLHTLQADVFYLFLALPPLPIPAPITMLIPGPSLLTYQTPPPFSLPLCNLDSTFLLYPQFKSRVSWGRLV